MNRAGKGRRYKTDEYEAYETKMLLLLPRIDIPDPPYRIFYEFGFSNSLSDYDNPCKPLGDILQKKYQFNDKEIYEAHIRKRIVKQGEEYIRVRIEHIDIEGYGRKETKKDKRSEKKGTVVAKSRIQG